MRRRSTILLHLFALAIPCFGFVSIANSTSSPTGQTPQTPPTAAAREPQAEMPVSMVALFSSGVGYFEHSGVVKGDATTELRFKTEQINDILKSLVLEDLDGGQVGPIVYPSIDPLSKTLQSFQVDISSNPSLPEILNRIRGTDVQVSLAGEQFEGLVLGMEKRPEALVGTDNEAVDAWILNVLSGAAVRSVALDDIQKIEMKDPKLEEELHKALSALSQARSQDKKPVVISFRGQGERRVRLRYVVEAPIWKTSYRLILPNDGKGQAKLQGWAIVENQTDNDWNNVRLSLVSGRPISFIEDLYQPLYASRPEVKPDLGAGVKPQAYEAGMAKKGMATGLAAVAPAPAAMALEKSKMDRSMGAAPSDAMEQEKPFDPTASVVAAASGEKMGELFQYTIDKVSLPRQRSAMIPILTDPVSVERVSIYNRSVLPRNPLHGAFLKNTTGKHLLQGPITIFDGGGYAGDARIGDVPPGQERLLSYAVDLEVGVDATAGHSETAILSGKIVKGVLELSRKRVFQQEYTAENKSDKERTLIIEHPFRPGWKLVNSPEPFETTETLHRFKERIPAAESRKLTLTEEIVQGETIAILPADHEQILTYSRAGEIPKGVREALGKAADLKRSMAETERKIAEKRGKIDDITQEQERIRENLKTVQSSTQYYSRLIGKLNEQESTLEKLQDEMEKLHGTYDAQRKELEGYLSGLTVG
ncbi:MAG: DUF4139 domain-containing protein [Syntrophobacteraceae bacterium]